MTTQCIDWQDHLMVIDDDTMYCKKCSFVLFKQTRWVRQDDGMEYDTSRLKIVRIEKVECS